MFLFTSFSLPCITLLTVPLPLQESCVGQGPIQLLPCPLVLFAVTHQHEARRCQASSGAQKLAADQACQISRLDKCKPYYTCQCISQSDTTVIHDNSKCFSLMDCSKRRSRLLCSPVHARKRSSTILSGTKALLSLGMSASALVLRLSCPTQQIHSKFSSSVPTRELLLQFIFLQSQSHAHLFHFFFWCSQFKEQPSNLAKYSFMVSLRDQNIILFFAVSYS